MEKRNTNKEKKKRNKEFPYKIKFKLKRIKTFEVGLALGMALVALSFILASGIYQIRIG